MTAGGILGVNERRDEDFARIAELIMDCDDPDAVEPAKTGGVDIELPFVKKLTRELKPIMGSPLEKELYAYIEREYGCSVSRHNDVEYHTPLGIKLNDGARLHIEKKLGI